FLAHLSTITWDPSVTHQVGLETSPSTQGRAQRGIERCCPVWARVVGCGASSPSEEKTVIIRVFRPTIHPGKEREFEAFLRDTAIPLVSQQAGLGAQWGGRAPGPASAQDPFRH